MQKRASGRCPGDPYMRLRDQLTMMLVDETVPNGLVIIGSEVLEELGEGREDGAGERREKERPIDIPPEWEVPM